MARSPSPLPLVLGETFTYAEALAVGVTPRRLRHRDLITPTRGLRLTTPDPDLLARAVAHRKVLPQPFAYSHATATGLLELPGPCDPKLHVTLQDGVFVRRRGMVMHRGLDRRDVWWVHGLPVISPVWTWLDVAAGVASIELVYEPIR